MSATMHCHERIACVFDFDGTLAPDTFDLLLERCGQDADRFRDERVGPLEADGWDTALARVWALVQLAQEEPGRVTRGVMEEVGRSVELFPGVGEMPQRLRDAAQAVLPAIEVEFCILSAGFRDLILAVPAAKAFDAVWGMELLFDAQERPVFAKQIITHPQKVRYILQLSKGLDTHGPNSPSDVWREVPEDELHVPLSQVIYVGDGASDLPAFQLMNERGGFAIAVDEADRIESWPMRNRMYPGRRVHNLVPADFSEGSELMRTLTLAVESIAKSVAIKKMSVGK